MIDFLDLGKFHGQNNIVQARLAKLCNSDNILMLVVSSRETMPLLLTAPQCLEIVMTLTQTSLQVVHTLALWFRVRFAKAV